MPFYFKDLRDNTFIFFRAYIEGLTENISPSYASHNYNGRSEPVYTYERAEREISMTLKLFAHTFYELEAIYQKLNRLTSLCYPQYQEDENMSDVTGTSKMRMKPPLTKMRLGELFGNSKEEVMGFFKSVNYIFPDKGVWETKQNKRVPKFIEVTISYQIIHKKPPAYGQKFYGFVGRKKPTN